MQKAYLNFRSSFKSKIIMSIEELYSKCQPLLNDIFRLTTDKEISLTKYGVVSQTSPLPIFHVPLATFKRFAPITLTVNASSQENIYLTAVTKDATNYEGSFDLTGRTVICECYIKHYKQFS